MTDQGRFSFMNPAKGGAGKIPREDSLEDAISQMAEAHARVTLKAAQSRGNSETVLNESITVVIEQALATILPNVAADIRSEWGRIYRDRFWSIYHLEA